MFYNECDPIGVMSTVSHFPIKLNGHLESWVNQEVNPSGGADVIVYRYTCLLLCYCVADLLLH